MDHVGNKATSVVDHKFCLGGDVFLSVSYFKGLNNIHIRKWKSTPDDFNPGKYIVYPTKVGIMISREQLKQLKNLIPHVLSFLDANEQQQQTNQSTQSTSASPVLPPSNAPALVDPNFTTTTPATLPAELSDIGFSQLFYGADAGDRENDTISVSSVNDIETPSTSPGYNTVSGVGGQSTLNGGGAGVAGGSKTVNTTFRETPKRQTGLLSLKNAPKKRKN